MPFKGNVIRDIKNQEKRNKERQREEFAIIYERTKTRMLSKSTLCFLACTVGLFLIYFFGFLYLFLMVSSSFSIKAAADVFNMAVMPFVFMDLFKIMIILNINKILLKNEKNQL